MNSPATTMRSLLGGLGLLLAVGLHAETWRFAVIGDTPYSSYEERQLPAMLDDIAAENPQFVVHAGDFKSSSKPCSDALFSDRRALFDASRVPLIYVPGDNEWTDCRRLAAGGFDPLERLQKLRELFFATPRSLGRQALAVEQQPGAYPEQLRWRLGPVLFVSLNVPGSNNNFRLPDLGGNQVGTLDEGEGHSCPGFRMREILLGEFLEERGDGSIMGWAGHPVNFDGQGVGQSVRFDVGGRNEQFANERTRVVLLLQVATQ